MNRCVTLTCGGGAGSGSSSEVVDVPVDEGQVLDDVSAQSSLLQQVPSMLIDDVLSFTLGFKQTVVLNKVLAQVNFGAGVLEGAGAVRSRTFVIVQTHLRTVVRIKSNHTVLS